MITINPIVTIPNLSTQVISALVFLEHNNIVHGAITPENILITREGIVKIGV